MKKYISVLIVFSLFITFFSFLGFNANSASAQTITLPEGCTSTQGYSPTTGVKCDTVFNPSLPVGCTSTQGYSPVTGVKCDTVFNPNLPAGCTSTQGYSPTTGVRCDSGGQTFPAGCTSNTGFSTTTGMPCSGGPVPISCPSITINGTVYSLNPCDINATMVDGQGNKDFSTIIVGSGGYGFSRHGYGAGFPTYGILGDSSGGAYGNTQANFYFNDDVLSANGNQPKTYTGYLPIHIYQGSETGETSNYLNLNINLTVDPVTIQPSITVLSPNGGETWTKGTTQNIKWQDSTIYPTCPPNAYCTLNMPVPKFYDITLALYYPPCTTNICPSYPYRAPYTIAKGVYGSSYEWIVGNTKDIGTVVGDSVVSDGSYNVQICVSGSDRCDSSDSYFKIIKTSMYPPGCTSDQGYSPTTGEYCGISYSTAPTLSASLIDASSDFAGLWDNFGPGVGNGNKTKYDWHWNAMLNVPARKLTKSITLTHKNGYEGWSTASNTVYGKKAYPLVVRKFDGLGGSANQYSSYYDGSITFDAGTHNLDLYGQIETETFSGGTLVITFTDGTTVSADIPASSIKPPTSQHTLTLSIAPSPVIAASAGTSNVDLLDVDLSVDTGVVNLSSISVTDVSPNNKTNLANLWLSGSNVAGAKISNVTRSTPLNNSNYPNAMQYDFEFQTKPISIASGQPLHLHIMGDVTSSASGYIQLQESGVGYSDSALRVNGVGSYGNRIQVCSQGQLWNGSACVGSTTTPTFSVSCSALNTAPQTGQEVTWGGAIRGGAAPYSATWKYEDSISPVPASDLQSRGTVYVSYPKRTYNFAGTKTATFTATSGNQTQSATCSVSVVTAPPPPLPSSTLSSGLVGHWKFDDGSALDNGIANDASGNGNNGLLSGKPSSVAGKIGQALSFDGNDYVELNEPSALTPSTITLSAWIKTGSNSRSFIIGKSKASWTSYNMEVLNGRVFAHVGTDSATNGPNVSSTQTINDNAWHHVAVTYNGSTLALFVDGAMSGNASGGSTIYYESAGWGHNTHNHIGAHVYSGEVIDYPFNGQIDEVRIYNRALSASEVAQVYSEGGGGISSASGTLNLSASALSAFSSATNSETIPTNTSASVQIGVTKPFRFTLWLEEGMRGNEVMELQKFLNGSGYDSGTIDGIFGSKTKSAVMALQTAKNLKSDGIVGYEVRSFLNK